MLSWAEQVFQPLVSITRMPDELSVALPQAEVPDDPLDLLYVAHRR